MELTYRGPARISGAAGTGKTVVALHRAAHLARKSGSARVLLTTFSRTLAFRLGQQADILLATEPETRRRIAIDHVHKVARDVWTAATGNRFEALDSDVLNQVLERANRTAKAQFPLTFVRAEWDAIIQPGGISSWEEYKRAPRTNRGTPLGARQRLALWSVFETAIRTLSERGLMTWEQLCFEAADTAGKKQFTHVVADEYQDLGPSELKLLRALASDDEEGLFLCGDSGQRIYKGRASWLSLGIDVRGRSHSLTVNYRTTEQVRKFADKILADPGGKLADEPDRRSISLLSGPEPRVQGYGTMAEEIEGAATALRTLRGEGYESRDIAIFAHGQATLRERAEAACRKAGVEFRELSDDSSVVADAVSVGTMHRAKGLEFKAVLVMGCDDKLLPMRSVMDRLSDAADRDAFVEQEQRLLYVACTRGRERLLVTHTGRKSRFVP